MTVQSIKEQLESAHRPIAKSFHTGDHFKVLVFGFKKGMKLDDHTTNHPTKLLILEGEVIYHRPKKDLRLKQFDEIDIPAKMEHSVAALEDSIVLLTQG